jgi:hypothetical protein
MLLDVREPRNGKLVAAGRRDVAQTFALEVGAMTCRIAASR